MTDDFCPWIQIMKVDPELQFDWIENRWVSCWRLWYG